MVGNSLKKSVNGQMHKDVGLMYMVLYSLTYGAFLHVGTEGFANNIILNGWKYFIINS